MAPLLGPPGMQKTSIICSTCPPPTSHPPTRPADAASGPFSMHFIMCASTSPPPCSHFSAGPADTAARPPSMRQVDLPSGVGRPPEGDTRHAHYRVDPLQRPAARQLPCSAHRR
eukprot:147615-Chlamydomonas_euryale.AAC.1